MSKLKGYGYPEIYLGQSDDFKFAIKIKTVEKYQETMGGKIFKEYNLICARFSLAVGIPSRIPYHYPVFVSVEILTNDVEVDINERDDLH